MLKAEFYSDMKNTVIENYRMHTCGLVSSLGQGSVLLDSPQFVSTTASPNRALMTHCSKNLREQICFGKLQVKQTS